MVHASLDFPTNYYVKLPAYQGVNYKQAPCYKNTELKKGDNYCKSVTGGGSYAIHYQMTNSNNEIRGDYKVLQEALKTIQTFNHCGKISHTYYLKFMNNNSISSTSYATVLWNNDIQ